MKRSRLMRRSPMCRGKRKSKYARRPRDFDFMGWVKTQPCAVALEWPAFPVEPTECSPGVIEADHMGSRGLGQKAADTTCVGLCSKHHRERTDHSGTFKHMTRDEVRAWRERAMLRTQTNYAEGRGEVVA